jgi:L-asparaginase
MKRNIFFFLLASVLSISSSFAADSKPGVTIYATGGTIAGSSKSNTDTTDYKAGSLGVEVLIKAVPELQDVATISGEQTSNVASGDITQAILLKLAKTIKEMLNNSV